MPALTSVSEARSRKLGDRTTSARLDEVSERAELRPESCSVRPGMRWTLSALIGACFASAGCGDYDEALQIEPCQLDSECPASSVCGLDGFCVPSEFSQFEDFALDLVPPPRSRFVPVQVSPETGPRGTLTLRLPEPVVYETEVLGPDGSVSADLTFSPMGSPRLAQATTSREDPIAIALAPGTYAVSIAPHASELPPIRVEGFSVLAGPSPRPKEFRLPERYRSLSGIVRSRVSVGNRVEGARVRAVGVESGLSSTTVVTDEEGSYRLALPEAGDTSFVLHAAPPEALEPGWSYRQTVRVPPDEDREKAIDLDLPSVAIQGYLELDVVGLGAAGPEAVASADVRLTSTSSAGDLPRTFVIEGRTDANGLLRVPGQDRVAIIRGSYRIEVTPPARSLFAATDRLVAIDAASLGNTAEIQMALERRPTLRGTVLAANGSPVPFADLLVSPLGRTGREFVTTSNELGAFQLPVDPGRALIQVLPRNEATTVVQPHLAQALEIGVADDAPDLRLQLPAGGTTSGQVLDRTGVGVAGVDVVVWSTIDGFRYERARATSDTLGWFELILPAR